MNKKCQGCGITLQTDNQNIDGFVQDVNQNICQRCFQMKNYGKYKQSTKSNSDFEKILDNIKNEDLVVYITSILNINLNYINKFNKVILVITKLDIMPKSLKEEKLRQNILKLCPNNKIEEIVFVSSLKKYNIDRIHQKILENKLRKIYFVGTTNSGKSSLINSLLNINSNTQNQLTTSPYPSTTLDIVEISLGEVKIFDTPGIVEKGSITNYLDLDMIKKANPYSEIKPRIYQQAIYRSILIEDFLRINILENKGSLVLFLSNNLKLKQVSKKNNYLQNKILTEINVKAGYDLIIEDLGFIKVTKNIHLKIYSMYEVNIYLRKTII